MSDATDQAEVERLIDTIAAERPPPHPEFGRPNAKYAYRDESGVPYLVRCYFGDGTLTQTAVLTKNGAGWTYHAPTLPVGLYGAENAAAGLPVILCLDEAAADGAAHLLRDHACVAAFSPHPEENDLSVLARRSVLIWPAVGQSSIARAFARALKPIAHAVKVLAPPPDKPLHWSAADAVGEAWGYDTAVAWLRTNKCRPPHVPEAPKSALGTDSLQSETTAAELGSAGPFQVLGFGRGAYFFLPRNAREVTRITAADLTPRNLLKLAPLSHWESFSGCKSGEPMTSRAWLMIANVLMRQAEAAGVYDPSRRRGRGAWLDQGRIVLHLGDRLKVDGQDTPLGELKTEYIYEAGARFRLGDGPPITGKQAQQFLEMMKLLPWARGIAAYLGAGWLAAAPINGALDWRPHACIVGPPGSGKSWILEHIVSPMLGNIGAFFAENTTEPGIRRALGSDARPVFVDEFEGEDRNAHDRIKSIFHLARAASSESSAKIVMALPGGGGVEEFQPRFMMMTAGTGSLLSAYADRTRHSMLSLCVRGSGTQREQQFAHVKAVLKRLMTPTFIAGWQARAIELIPVIRQNAEIFAVASARSLGSRRLGDQSGTLVGAIYSMIYGKPATMERAAEWLNEQDWSEERELAENTDPQAILDLILQHKIRVDAPRGSVERSLGELLHIVRGGNDPMILDEVAQATLCRNGLRWFPDEKELAVSNTHSALVAILRDSPCPVNWHIRLRDLPGAHAAKDANGANRTVTFVGGSTGESKSGSTRATMVPLE